MENPKKYLLKQIEQNDLNNINVYITVGVTIVMGVFMTLPIVYKTIGVFIGCFLIFLNGPKLIPKQKFFFRFIAYIFLGIGALLVTMWVYTSMKRPMEEADQLAEFIERSRLIRAEFPNDKYNGWDSKSPEIKKFYRLKNDFYNDVTTYIENNLTKSDLVLFKTGRENPKVKDFQHFSDDDVSELLDEERILQETITELKRQE